MRIFVYEYVTGGGLLGRPLPALMVQEGELVLQALLQDLVGLGGIEVTVLRDARMPPIDLPVTVRTLYHSRELPPQLRRGLEQSDALLPVAPETAGALQAVSETALAQRRRLLGSRPEAVAVAASKRRTVRRLGAHDLPVVPTWGGEEVLAGAPLPPPPWVVKPDDGVGCAGTRILWQAAELRRRLQAVRHPEALVVQPFLSGQHVSLSVVCGKRGCRLLSGNLQRMVVVNDEFRRTGWVVNGLQYDRRRMERLARAVFRALPGLWGYFGIDLILTADGPVILEVNPRLTTCYAGLSRALGVNAAGLMLGRGWDGPVAGGAGSVVLDLEVEYAA